MFLLLTLNIIYRLNYEVKLSRFIHHPELMNSVFHVGVTETMNKYVSASVPTLYPLKTAENLKFSDVFWGYQIGTFERNGLNTTLWKKIYF